MEVIIKGEAKEIAALVLAVQERQTEDIAEEVGTEFAKRLHQEIRNRMEANRSAQESQ